MGPSGNNVLEMNLFNISLNDLEERKNLAFSELSTMTNLGGGKYTNRDK